MGISYILTVLIPRILLLYSYANSARLWGSVSAENVANCKRDARP